MLFLSTYTNKLDSKGRVSVPATFRAMLATEDAGNVILFRSSNYKCLEGFGLATMMEISKRLDQFDLFSDEQDDLATTIFGEAQQISIDGDGRIKLPEDLCAFAGLKDKACFVGLGRKFQIWSPENYESRRDTARNQVQKKGLTIPRITEGLS